MTDPEFEKIERYSSYLDGEMPEPERAEFEAALASDPELRADFEQFRAAMTAVQSTPRGAAPDGFDQQVRSRISRRSRGKFFRNDSEVGRRRALMELTVTLIVIGLLALMALLSVQRVEIITGDSPGGGEHPDGSGALHESGDDAGSGVPGAGAAEPLGSGNGAIGATREESRPEEDIAGSGEWSEPAFGPRTGFVDGSARMPMRHFGFRYTVRIAGSTGEVRALLEREFGATRVSGSGTELAIRVPRFDLEAAVVRLGAHGPVENERSEIDPASDEAEIRVLVSPR